MGGLSGDAWSVKDLGVFALGRILPFCLCAWFCFYFETQHLVIPPGAGMDILLWRAGSMYSGHLLDWYCLGAVVVVGTFYPGMSWETMNGSRGAFVAAAVLSYHELGWNVVAAVVNWFYWVGQNLGSTGFEQFAAALLVTAFVGVRKRGYGMFDKKIMLVGTIGFVGIMGFWYGIGFPTTVESLANSLGFVNTDYYSVPLNAFEEGTWWYVAVVFLVAFVKGVGPWLTKRGVVY